MRTSQTIAVVIVSSTLLAGGAFADPIKIPNTFAPRTPALAEEVNENFSAVAAGVNDVDRRVTENRAAIDELNDAAGAANLPIWGPGIVPTNRVIGHSPATRSIVDSIDLPAGSWWVNFQVELKIIDYFVLGTSAGNATVTCEAFPGGGAKHDSSIVAFTVAPGATGTLPTVETLQTVVTAQTAFTLEAPGRAELRCWSGGISGVQVQMVNKTMMAIPLPNGFKTAIGGATFSPRVLLD